VTYEVQQTRWDRLIRRVSGSIGPGSRVSETISELFPVMDVERVPGELLLLGGTSICHGAGAATGAVGEIPNLILFNPPDSGHLITITQIAVEADVAGRIRCELSQATSGAALDTERFREGRLVTAITRPVGQLRSLSNPSQIEQQCSFDLIADVSTFFSDVNGLAVLSPDTKYVVATVTTASTVRVTFWWREREAQVSELQF